MTILENILSGIGVTLSITVLATIIGVVLGAPLAAMRLSSNALLSSIATAFINLIRGIPTIVWLFVIFYGVGSGYIRLDPFLTAVGVLGIITVVQMAEVYRGGLLSVPRGQAEAAQVLGFSPTIIFLRIRIPQALLAALPAASTVVINLIKESAVASIIGVQDITGRAVSYSLRSEHDILIYVLAAGLYILISIPVALAARRTHRLLSERVHVK